MSIKKGILDYNVGEKFHGFLLVKNVNKGTTRNGKEYLNVTLNDKTGEIKTMVWDSDTEKESIFANGNIVKISGNIVDYLGNKQLNLESFRLKQETDKVELQNFLKTAPIPEETLVKDIEKEIDNISNEVIKTITKKIFNKYKEDFKVYPAAKRVHHNYISGLAYHTHTMMNVAKSLCLIYPELNKDLLIAGVILHDMGKVIEYTGNVSTEYTLKGKLIGHISIMSEEIGTIAEKLDLQESEEKLLLQHMVLSHHGKGEWGSPVAPMIIEAQILHQIDMIDANMDAYRNSINKVNKGEFTEKIFGLSNKSFYFPKI